MALNFPFEMFMQAMQAKRQNQDQMNQNISGIGQSLGGTLTDLGQQAEESRKQKIVQQLMQIMRQKGQPSQGPQLPGASQPGMPTPNSGMGSPPPNQSGNIMALMTQLDPAGAASSYMQQQDPLRQSEAQKNLAMADFYRKRGIGTAKGSSGDDVVTAYYNPDTKEISPIPKDGFEPFEVKRGSLGSLLTKPPKPVSAKPDYTPQKLDLQADIANTKLPWYTQLFGIGSGKIRSPMKNKISGPKVTNVEVH